MGFYRYGIVLLLLSSMMQAAIVKELQWDTGKTFLSFLEEHELPLSTYYELDAEEKELAAEIRAGTTYHLLTDEENGGFQQVLIPISEEMQLQLVRTSTGCDLDFVPISFQQKEESLTLEIQRSPYLDIVEATKNHALANEVVTVYKNSIDFRRDIRKNDRVALLYTQRYRLGKRHGQPLIHASIIETGGRENYIFLHEDGRYYDEQGREVEGFLLNAPLKYRRISSKFTKKRWHPILKKYRPHLGVDYAANRGTPVKAAGNGKIIHVGRKGGYGKTVIIQHNGTYKTLYAHLKGYGKGIKRGRRVEQGRVIGYVGSTGLSTGPHLHFGLYRNGRAINPLSKVKIKRNALQGKDKQNFVAQAERYKESLQDVIMAHKQPEPVQPVDFVVQLDQHFQSNIN